MSKDMTEQNDENIPARQQDLQHNSFERHGAQATQRNIVGQLLKFSKGRWIAGMNSEEIEEGTQLIVDMRTLTVGWQKWESEKPVDNHMGLVIENFQPPARRAIGDMEKEFWEEDEHGVRRDPWQSSNMLLMRAPGTSGEEEGLYTFTTNSRGGLTAVGVVSKAYGRKIRENPDLLPIVELRGDSYPHSNKRFGIIDIPVFKIIGWGTCANIVEGADDFEMIEEVKGPETKKTLPAPKREAAKAAPKKAEPKKVKGKRDVKF